MGPLPEKTYDDNAKARQDLVRRQCQELGIEGFTGELGREEIRTYIDQIKEVMSHLTTQAERVKVLQVL